VTLTFSEVHLAVNTAPTGSAIVVDIHKDDVTIFTTQSNRPQISAGANEGNTTTFNVTTIADGQHLKFDIDAVGSTVAGADLVVQIILTGG